MLGYVFFPCNKTCFVYSYKKWYAREWVLRICVYAARTSMIVVIVIASDNADDLTVCARVCDFVQLTVLDVIKRRFSPNDLCG